MARIKLFSEPELFIVYEETPLKELGEGFSINISLVKRMANHQRLFRKHSEWVQCAEELYQKKIRRIQELKRELSGLEGEIQESRRDFDSPRDPQLCRCIEILWTQFVDYSSANTRIWLHLDSKQITDFHYCEAPGCPSPGGLHIYSLTTLGCQWRICQECRRSPSKRRALLDQTKSDRADGIVKVDPYIYNDLKVTEALLKMSGVI